MSAQELEALMGMLREQGAGLMSAEPVQARADFEAMMAPIPLGSDARFEQTRLGSVPALKITTAQSDAARTLIYLHGGAYVIGSANAYRGLASNLARAAGAVGYSLDYRLGPEVPFPGAVDDAVAAYRALLDQGRSPASIAVAGDSAGGGLAVAMLVAARRAGQVVPGHLLQAVGPQRRILGHLGGE